MGCVPLTLQTMDRHVALVGGYQGCKMMEIGDQQMYCHSNIPEGSAAKAWFSRMGVEHTSIDLNGELGALPLDISKPIERSEWDEHFDVVTDFGTSEHVGKPLTALYNARANCHRWCRPGGIMLFNNPRAGHWPGHGYHYFVKEHYSRLAGACHYKVVELWEHPTLGNSVDGYQVFAVLMKQETGPFLTEEQFADICNGTVFTS